MNNNRVIVLSDYQQTAALRAAKPRCCDSDWRLRRRCERLLAAVEGAVTVCIGVGFFVCLGLVVCML